MSDNKIKLIPSYSKINDYPILDDKYYLIRKLGSGATSTVKLGKRIIDGKCVAVKIMKIKGMKYEQLIKHFKTEIEVLSVLSHPNIVNIIDHSEGRLSKPQKDSYLVNWLSLDLCSNGELFDYVYYLKAGFEEKIAARIFNDILNGLETCHSAGIAHRDLKTENLLLDSDWNVKIGDFGYATFVLPGEKLTSFMGTVSYAAPEVLLRSPYFPFPADIFSLGVILFILVTGKFPFSKAFPTDSFYKYFKNNQLENFWKTISQPLSEKFKSLINFLLAYDPLLRPSFTEIRNHPFMANMATKDEVVEELEKRKKIVKQLKEKDISKFPSKDSENFFQNNFNNCQIKVKEYSDNNLSPYKLKIKSDCVAQLMNYINEYFTSKNFEVNFREHSSKINAKMKTSKSTNVLNTNINNSKIEPEDFELEIEIRKTNEKDEKWVVEFYLITGCKAKLNSIFEDLVKSLENNN